MGDLLDGDGNIVTDGDGTSLFDGDGPGAVGNGVSTTTALAPFITRIQRDIEVPDFLILPYLYDILADFTRKTWILCKSYEVQGSGVADSVNKSVAFNTADTVPGLIPLEVARLKDLFCDYKAVHRDVVGGLSSFNLPSGRIKYYNFYGVADGFPETFVRIFPWDSDPLIFLVIAFRTKDEPATVPAILLDYKEEICSGVMSRMMLQPGAEWFNPNLSVVRDGMYQSGVNKAKFQWFKNNSRPVVTGKRFI